MVWPYIRWACHKEFYYDSIGHSLINYHFSNIVNDVTISEFFQYDSNDKISGSTINFYTLGKPDGELMNVFIYKDNNLSEVTTKSNKGRPLETIKYYYDNKLLKKYTIIDNLFNEDTLEYNVIIEYEDGAINKNSFALWLLY